MEAIAPPRVAKRGTAFIRRVPRSCSVEAHTYAHTPKFTREAVCSTYEKQDLDRDLTKGETAADVELRCGISHS